MHVYTLETCWLPCFLTSFLFKVNRVFLLPEISSVYPVHCQCWDILYFKTMYRKLLKRYWSTFHKSQSGISRELRIGHIYFSRPQNSGGRREREIEKQCDKFNIEMCYEDLMKMSRRTWKLLTSKMLNNMTYRYICSFWLSGNRFFDVLNSTFFLGKGQELEGRPGVQGEVQRVRLA